MLNLRFGPRKPHTGDGNSRSRFDWLLCWIESDGIIDQVIEFSEEAVFANFCVSFNGCTSVNDIVCMPVDGSIVL